jgi:hypothetical protein
MILTYLGHQGWALSARSGAVLIDPIFRTIGNGNVQLPVWPDREIAPEKLGPVAGLIISHEHSDHFDVDTLYRMPWRGDVFVSDRSSTALTTLLTDLGYAVRKMRPYMTMNFDDVTVTSVPLEWSLLEPDPYGFLANCSDGTSFFTSVDGMPHKQTVRWLKQNCPQRTIDNFTNNYLEPLPELTGVAGADNYSTGTMVQRMISATEMLAPRRVVLSGQGWSYPVDYSELNARFFSVTHQTLVPIMRQIYPRIGWEAPQPGTAIDLNGRTPDGVVDYIVRREPSHRDYAGFTAARDGAPWSRTAELPDDQMIAVERYVASEFGRQVNAHAPELMEGLYALASDPANTLRPTVALRLLNGQTATHYILDHGSLTFAPAPTGLNVRRDAAGGIEMWASDLYNLINGHEEAFLIAETAVRRWSNAPRNIGRALHIDMLLGFAPRFQPNGYLEMYRMRFDIVRQQASQPALSGRVAR